MQEVPIEDLLCAVVKFFVSLQQSLLWTKVESGTSSTGDSTFLRISRFHCGPLRSSCLNLLDYLIAWIDVVNDSEEPSYFSFVSWHNFQLVDEVVALGRIKQCKLIDIFTVTHFVHLKRVLLQFEHLQ